MLDEVEFEKFWTAYPKKRAKGDAFKAWKSTKAQRPEISRILRALAVFKGSPEWRQDAGQWIPYPGTWIRAWRWEDILDVDLKDVLPNGKLWWESTSGVEAKAKEIGLEWTGEHLGAFETFQQFTKRVRALIESNKVVPLRVA